MEERTEPNPAAPSDPTGEAAVEAAHRDPAASMLLLRTIEQYSLDPSYHEAAKQKTPTPRWTLLLIFLGIVALAWMTTVAAMNLRVTWDDESPRAQLSKQVREVQERIEELEDHNAEFTAQIRATEVLEGISDQMDLSLALDAAYVPVSGPGVVVTFTDDSSRSGFTRDADIRFVTNLLWETGAEAISINGKRVGPSTTIRTAGSSILVNLHPIASPYVIEAIGDPIALMTALQTGPGSQGLSTITRASGVTLSKTRAENLTMDALPLPSPWSVSTMEDHRER